MNFASLFAGIGGFDLALERAGLECAWQCERDKTCSAVLSRHWPTVRRYDDVRTLDASTVAPVDVLCGGWPCQDLSVAGNRAGLAGERSGLFVEVVRLARDLAPGWLVLENVPGLLSSHGGRDMGAVLAALGECGYRWAYRVLDAQHWGVPQRRRRVFIVASLGAGCPGEVLFEREGLPWDSAAGGGAGEGVAAVSAGGSGGRGWRIGADEAAGGQIVAQAMSAKWAKGTSGPAGDEHHNLIAHQCHAGPVNVPFTVQATFSEGRGPHAREASTSKCIDGHGGNPDSQQGGTLVACSRTVRRLTPTEAERLQGFPDGWTEGHADGPRYRMLGNAVAVPVVEWIARRLVAVEFKVRCEKWRAA